MTDDRRNFLPSDPHKERIDEIFMEAEHWLDGTPIATEGEAEAVTKLLNIAREARDAADRERAAEKKPHDDAGKAVQERYRPILARAESITEACKTLLTTWRKSVAQRQQDEADEQRQIAEAARAEAQRVAGVAKGNAGAMEIAKGADEIATRFEKQADRLEKKVGTGLRMRTVRHGTIIDLKVTIAHFYRTDQDWMMSVLQEHVDAAVRGGSATIPGVEITETKEAY